MLELDKLIDYGTNKGASDIHLTPGMPVYFRINGKLYPVQNPIENHEIQQLLKTVLTKTQYEKLEEEKQVDFMFQLPSKIRLRGNAFYSHEGFSVVFRIISHFVPEFSQLGFPPFVRDKIMTMKQGLVLVVGPTGQGKSTTLASMLHERNREKTEHIITVEDPIEFILQPENCVIQQREVGKDVRTYDEGLLSALRQDPNILMIGEMRDPETMSMALTFAETGHLVFSTLHTTNAIQTIYRIIDSFSADNQPQIRSQLAGNLNMIISQRLVPTSDESTRALAYEILQNNFAIGSNIRNNEIHQLKNIFETDNSGQMVQFEQSLASLVINKVITIPAAYEYAPDKQKLKGILEFNGITEGSPEAQ